MRAGRLARVKVTERLDAWQQRTPAAGLPIAVVRKFLDDDGSHLAALLTYYLFLSLIPVIVLLTLGITTLLRNDPELQGELLSALSGPELADRATAALDNLPSSPLLLAVGIGGLVITSLGVVRAAQRVLQEAWLVPELERHRGISGLWRLLAMLLVTLLAAVAAAGMGTLSGAENSWTHRGWRGAAVIGTFLVVFAALKVGSRLLLPRRLARLGDTPGAILAAASVTFVFMAGGRLVLIFVGRSGWLYGALAAVFGALALMYFVSLALVLGADLAAVRALGLSPRSLSPAARTEGDRAALTLAAQAAQRLPDEVITVTFGDAEAPGPDRSEPGPEGDSADPTGPPAG